ncbi:MAG: ATP-binding protein, partial [Clostridiales bacterium]|nr:ATP-binding protein [Clostridiales bacterium]
MSINVNNLFNFSRSLPAPFDKAPRKVKVSSVYGDKTESTLSMTVIKALNAICSAMSGTGRGAVGTTADEKCVAEYASSNAGEFHLVVYDADTGNLSAGVYNENTKMLENYIMNAKNRDGAAVMMAMFPALMADKEFEENFKNYFTHFLTDFSKLDESTNAAAILCDNAYRRIKDETCSAHLKINIDAAGNLTRISRAQLDSGVFAPKNVQAGEFNILAQLKQAGTIKKAKKIIDVSAFEGKYNFHTRAFSALEKSLIPKLPEWYIVPQVVMDICNHAQKTTGRPTQMRNFLLRGEAGTGKTMGAKAIAAGLGLPYMKYTCSAGTEIFDFIGQIFPDSENVSTGDAELDKEREELKAMGGINYENVAKLMNLPDLEDIEFDPSGVYLKLTGKEKQEATTQDCMALVLNLVTDKIKLLSTPKKEGENKGQTFRYVETDFLKALKHGYVVEIQEPTTIMQPGVLVGLNSLLEQEGSITLPTGEIIERHPDTVVVVTTNVSYEGCRGLNQSIIDRMSMVCDVDLPTPEVMVQRAMSVTGATDEFQVSQMV